MKEKTDKGEQGSGPGAKKDRSLEGVQDQEEGVKNYQKEMQQKGGSKKGGYRPSTEKSEQEGEHKLDQIRDGKIDPTE
jgi:hypothetical protein